MSYQGMRWFKCDLHMHTPTDEKHWRGDKGSCDMATALKYARRCYESGLECIAITDHNNCGKEFSPMVRSAFDELSVEFGYNMIVFPGFEISADVGKGMHVLAILQPSTTVDTIEHMITVCGVPMPRQKRNGNHEASTKRLPDILDEVQRIGSDGKQVGIVICPHPMETGIFDKERIADWLQAEEWRNPELLAVEVPKPVDQMSEGWRKLFANGADCYSEWRRIRSMATIQASDCKAFMANEDSKCIGSRYSWIKMSDPSIEALRQAFLDHDNRIRLQDNSPELDHPHGWIVSMSVRNTKFVADQSIFFSPELNCLIGGRGSGKSSLIEYLRMLTRNDVDCKDGSAAAAQLARIKDTLKDNSILRLEWDAGDGSERDVFEWKPNPPFSTESNILSREASDQGTVFRNLGVVIYSQKEISELTEDRGAGRLIELIDRELGAELSRARDEEAQIRSAAKQLFLARREQEDMERKQAIIQQELAELNRKWEARAAMRDAAREHKMAQDAKRHLKSVLGAPDAIQSELDAVLENVPEHFPALPAAAKDWKHAGIFTRLDKAIDQASAAFQADIRIVFERFKEQVNTATRKDADWQETAAYLNAADEAFEAACLAKGIAPDEVEELREIETQRRAKQAELENANVSLKQLRRRVEGMPDTLNRLSKVWKRQTELRQRFLSEIQKDMEKDVNGRAIVEFNLKSQADEGNFIDKWKQMEPRRNTGLGQKWESIGTHLFQQAVKADRCLWDTVADVLDSPDDYDLGDLNERKAEFVKWMREETDESQGRRTREKWESLRLERVADDLDFTLRRKNGDIAGSLKGGALSDGQRNTVVLSLLMARGNGPIIIDQPEDELDSDFIYHELRPVVRRIKRRRQILFATHNANLPVNGDAELVYALQADRGHGALRAQGGLDRESVKDAVLDIMEGSDTAFKRRREKYHF